MTEIFGLLMLAFGYFIGRYMDYKPKKNKETEIIKEV